MKKIEFTHYRDEKNRIYRRPYWNYANYMITKLELTGGHIGIMLIIEIAKIEFTGGHIGIMLFIAITKKELSGGHIGIKLIIEIAK